MLPRNVNYNLALIERNRPQESLERFREEHSVTLAESSDIKNCVPSREIEYRLGRSLAKNLLKDICSIGCVDLTKRENGAPNWPEGIVGSISHSTATCIVVMSESKYFDGIGIDIEEGGEFDSELEAHILEADEYRSFPDYLDASTVMRAVFCCKEAVFKALEAFLYRRIDFRDISINCLELHSSNVFDFTFRINSQIKMKRSIKYESFIGRLSVDNEQAVALALVVSSE